MLLLLSPPRLSSHLPLILGQEKLLDLRLALALRLRHEGRYEEEPDEADAGVEPENALALDSLHHDGEGVTGQEAADAGEPHGQAVGHGAHVKGEDLRHRDPDHGTVAEVEEEDVEHE